MLNSAVILEKDLLDDGIGINLPLSSSDGRGFFDAPEMEVKMEYVCRKKQVKLTLAQKVGNDINNFADLVMKIMEIKGMTWEEVCRGCGMLKMTFSKVMRNGGTPKLTTVVNIAFGLGLQHEEFYWFLSQGNVGLCDYRDYDRMIRTIVDNGYEPWDVVGMGGVHENDPYCKEFNKRVKLGLAV